MRRTDAVVHGKRQLAPVSVAAGRIAPVALRCAVLLAKLDAAARPVDRTGAGTVVAACPAASLRRWGLRHPRRSSPQTPDALASVAEDRLAAAPWPDRGAQEKTIRRSHAAFDAVIAALTARAASLGQAPLPAEEDLATARTEDWIAIPDAPISQLICHRCASSGMAG